MLRTSSRCKFSEVSFAPPQARETRMLFKAMNRSLSLGDAVVLLLVLRSDAAKLECFAYSRIKLTVFAVM